MQKVMWMIDARDVRQECILSDEVHHLNIRLFDCPIRNGYGGLSETIYKSIEFSL